MYDNSITTEKCEQVVFNNHLRLSITKIFRSMRPLQVAANVVPSSPIRGAKFLRNVGSYSSHTV
jgi:hypothetical protein